MKSDKKIRFTGFLSGRITINNIRIIIGIVFIVLILIIIFYHLYFETEVNGSKEESLKIPKLSKIKSNSILDDVGEDIINIEHPGKDISQITIEFRNPSILKIENKQYLIAFEVRINQTPSIWLTESKDGKTWSKPWDLGINLPNLSQPYLEYSHGNEIIITYISNSKRYMQISKTGHTWSLPIIWNHDLIDETVYYGEHYILVTNETGIWLSQISGDIDWKQLSNETYENSSLLRENEFKFQIVTEDSNNNYKSLTLTNLDFMRPEPEETVLKWDLLVLFVFLGFIILAILVNEVARE